MDMTKKTFDAFTMISVADCGYELKAEPVGGKTSEDQPANACFLLYKAVFNPETGIKAGEKMVDVLRDENERVVLAAWSSAAERSGSKRTWNRVNTAAFTQFRSELRELAGIPENARRPLAVAALIKRVRHTAAIARDVPAHQVPISDVVTMAKLMDPGLAAWINNDGSYKPPAKKATKKPAKK